MQSAAGGTIQRLKPGAATVRSRSRIESGRIRRVYCHGITQRTTRYASPPHPPKRSSGGTVLSRFGAAHRDGGRIGARPGLEWPMPELPDLSVYREALQQRIVGQRLDSVLIRSPFLLRTVDPPIGSAQGRRATEVRRIGKRLAIGLEGDLWLVFHLMIAGRLHWIDTGAPLGKRAALARLQWGNGTLTLTEAGTKRRASLHLLRGEEALQRQDPGGLEVLTS